MIKSMILLIDGYNLLHAIEKGFIKSLQEKREKLIAKLHDYQIQKKVLITIVFDGSQPPPNFSNRDKRGQVEIIYTERGTSADEWISRACEKDPGSYVVVSSDQEVVREAERFDCMTLSAQAYLKKLTASTQASLENPYLEDKEEDNKTLYPRVTTKKKGVSKRLPKKERRKYHKLRNL